MHDENPMSEEKWAHAMEQMEVGMDKLTELVERYFHLLDRRMMPEPLKYALVMYFHHTLLLQVMRVHNPGLP